MKKIFNRNSCILLLASGIFILLLGGCKKVNTSSDLGTPRLFKPGAVTISAGQTSAKITWTTPIFATSGQKLSYTAAFSKDSLFATTEFTLTTDTTGVTVTDDKLAVRQKYFARIKANAYGDQAESKWMVSSGFAISGTQLFKPIRELDIKENSVTLRFTPVAGLTKITMTPATGQATDVPVTAAEAVAGIKTVTGLTAGTRYSAELFDTKSKGYLTFTTLTATVYTVVLNSGADLAAAITSAGNNAIIGLNPGTYSLTAAATPILAKTITLKSTSGNPADTKVNFKEFTLKGTGAGINVSGIEFDGAAPGSASYFINLTGAAADADAATFTSITIENCIIHNTAFCLIRANRAAVGAHKIDFIKVINTVGYDNPISSYDYFTLDKLAFNRLDVTKSTFYNLSRSIINCATVLTGLPAPAIVIDQCDFNNLGSDATKYIILDANTNPVNFTMQNSIIANVPRAVGVQTAAIRASVGTVAFNNNNVFKFVTTPNGTTAITLPSTAANNKTIDLGWTAATTDFTLPAASELRTFSTSGAAIGDPRWTY